MKSLLKQISEKAIELADFEFTQEQRDKKWLGTKPTFETEIKSAEKRLGIILPSDYKTFLEITNGFSPPNDVEPTFESIDKIDYLKNIHRFVTKVWNQDDFDDTEKQLERSILIGGITEEQYFLLIPPTDDSDEWKYLKSALWLAGEIEYHNLEHYFTEVLDFLNECLESN